MDPGCKWIVGILIGFVVGMAGYIVKQHRSEKKLLLQWLSSLQAQLGMVKLIETGSDPANPKGRP